MSLVFQTTALVPIPLIWVGKGKTVRAVVRSDLPSPGTHIRWSPFNKSLFVKAVLNGLITREGFLTLYGVEPEEFDSWIGLPRQKMPASPVISSRGEIRTGNLRVDLERKRVDIGGDVLDLTSLEYGLLICLVHHNGQSVSSERLIASVGKRGAWNMGHLKVHIFHLRRKLASKDQRIAEHLRAVWGRGYMFEDAPEEKLAA